MRSAGLFDWICKYQPDAHCEFAHGWWNSAEFWQLPSSDFESLDFGVIDSFSMTTPPPTSIITMPVVSARGPKLEIFFKESWVVEPNYTVTVKRQLPGPIILLDILQPIDQQNKWLLQHFPVLISMSLTVKELLLSLAASKTSTFFTACFTSSAFRPGNNR